MPSLPGEPRSNTSTILESVASVTQSFEPVSQICAFLNAFHVYGADRSRYVEACHYCSHPTEDLRQCIIYDSPLPNARLIGVEYMITPKLFETLPEDEKKYWHTHVYEVKSGVLCMPKPAGVPEAIWAAAEKKEMEQVVGLYGKTIHMWQVDHGDLLPIGPPQLMMSALQDGDLPGDVVKDRDSRYGYDTQKKKDERAYINEPKTDSRADGNGLESLTFAETHAK